MATTLVLGVGNPLMGDDAVGILAIERLRMRPDLPQQVDLIDGGTEGIGLIPVLERYSRAILVDAIDMSLPPGTIRRFSWQEVRMVSQHQALSLHQSSMADALMLADALDSLPSELVFYGVQPQNTEWDQPLSPSVERALPSLLDALINEVRSD